MTHIPDEWLSMTEPGLSADSLFFIYICENDMTTPISHHPVMLTETIGSLNIDPKGIYIDATFGRGGHSSAILEKLNDDGRLICFDKDPDAIAYGRELFENDPRVSFFQTCYSRIDKIAKQHGLLKKVNGILIDCGVSSPQLDDASRGFSFMRDGPLDMRMDPTQGLSASQWLNQATHQDIVRVLKRFGEEPFAYKIACRIFDVRKETPITTTKMLADLIKNCVPVAHQGKTHPATKTFQAIRIYINQEMDAIDTILLAAPGVLAPGGRLVMLSFHSLEDRKVKQFFRSQSRVQLPKGVSIPEKDLIAPLDWIVKRQRPSEEEIERNPRARSATMRVAQAKLNKEVDL